jgi:hypothetical protein
MYVSHVSELPIHPQIDLTSAVWFRFRRPLGLSTRVSAISAERIAGQARRLPFQRLATEAVALQKPGGHPMISAIQRRKPI